MSETPTTVRAEVVRPGPPRFPDRPVTFSPLVNVALFAMTLVTTVFAGTYLAHFDPDLYRFWINVKYRPGLLLDGLPFAGCLMAILGAHELGHYVMSRRHRVDCSLPYFLPGPNLVGTFGAVIMMRSSIPNRNALFDIGASGPLLGLIVTCFTMVLGFLHAAPECLIYSQNQGTAVVLFNPNLLMQVAGGLTAGGPGWEAVSHCGSWGLANLQSPLLDAAAIGFLITAINLLPLGQLDGGHISYALFGKKARWVSLAAVAAMAVLGYFWPPWLFMGVLLLILMGRKTLAHPEPQDPGLPLSPARKAIAVALLIALFLIIAPVPIDVIEIGF